MVRTEKNLMDMARSNLQEAMLRKYSIDGFRRLRADLECIIRQSAKENASLQDLSEGDRSSIMEAIDGDSLDSLFCLDC